MDVGMFCRHGIEGGVGGAQLQAVATRLQLGSRDPANISGEKPPAHLSSQLRYGVDQANNYLRDCGACGAARWSSWS